MQMGSSCAAGRADVTDDIAASDYFSLLYREFRHVQIDGFQTLAVIDCHGAAAQIIGFNDFHDSRGDGMDGRTCRSALIEARMIFAGRLSVVVTRNAE
jgi:hypothetical protein